MNILLIIIVTSRINKWPTIEKDGNLVGYDSGTAYWSIGVHPNPQELVMQNDGIYDVYRTISLALQIILFSGNLVAYDTSGYAYFAASRYTYNTLYGAGVFLVIQGDR